jgi:glycosyltransferase 2 family protein
MVLPVSVPSPVSPRAGRSVPRLVGQIVLVAACLGLTGYTVVKQWSAVSQVIGELSIWAVLAATVFALAGIWFSFLSWRALLVDFGSVVPLTGAMRIFFVGQLGKYVPGKVWPILAQVRLGRAHQVPGRTSAAAAGIVTLITLGAGLVVTAVTLPALGADAMSRYWWTLLVLPVAVLVLWPPVLNTILARLMKLARREPMPKPLSTGGVARAVGWALVMWLCYGFHLWILLAGTQALTPGLLIRCIGAFAGSWAIGFLLLLAPAGLGPREVALVAMLAGAVSQPVALVAALISRLLLTVADVFWPALALVVDRRRPGTIPLPDPAIPEPVSQS